MTTAENFRRVRNLFDAAMERPAAERTAYLESSCEGDAALLGEVRELMAAHGAAETWIDRPALGASNRVEGRRIGPWEVLREIAAGGMGTVYLARRADGAFEKKAALKILRPETASPEVLRRFQQERDILAALDHPNIARILDGGETDDGLPYLVMEFIDGQRIDRYCAEHRLGIDERLRLFRSVCAAVRYAHAQGVIHRDLKPSNILVDAEGVPKLLDFGISKVLASSPEEFTACVTRSGLWLMTPEYASPEQIRGDPSGVPTDVYSLGVLLYELLTGKSPYVLRDRVFHEVARVICEEPPERPSTAAPQDWNKRRLSGDLDAIILKALEKLPLRRYRSVDALDSEIGRFLEGQPVEARRRAIWDTAFRLMRRYSTLLIAALAVVTLQATGALHINAILYPTIMGGILGYGVMLWLQSRDMGRKTALGLHRSSLGIMVVSGAIGILLAFSIPKTAIPNAFVWFQIVFVAFVLYHLVRWPFRERWAGRLLVDLRRPRAIWMYGMLAFLLISIGNAAFAGWGRLRWSYFAGAPQVIAMCVWVSVLQPRLEIRERGIVAMGKLIPWRRIDGRKWDDAKEQTVVLRLICNGFLSVYPYVPLVVPANAKDAAEAALQRYLGEWPSRS
jgi:serine/threonine protein kinase